MMNPVKLKDTPSPGSLVCYVGVAKLLLWEWNEAAVSQFERFVTCYVRRNEPIVYLGRWRGMSGHETFADREFFLTTRGVFGRDCHVMDWRDGEMNLIIVPFVVPEQATQTV